MKLNVYGMSCPRCEAKLESALSELSEVKSVAATHESEHVVISTHAPIETMSDTRVQALRSAAVDCIFALGYQTDSNSRLPEQSALDARAFKDPITQTSNSDIYSGAKTGGSVVLDVTGMSCASCVQSVERALLAVDGVSFASVNYANSTVLVATKGRVEPLIAALVAAIVTAGYGAEVNAANDIDEKRKKLSFQLRRESLKALFALSAGTVLMLNMKLQFIVDTLLAAVAMSLAVLAILNAVGGRYYRSAWHSMVQMRATMDTLIALGTGTAWLFSTLTIAVPTLVADGTQALYFEAALFVIGFVHLGKTIEEYARGRTSLSVFALVNLQPATVVRRNNNIEEEVPIGEIMVHDQLFVRAGESIPLDGLVLEGRASVDEQMLTGEAIPIDKVVGDKVTGGTINTDGSLIVCVTEVGSNTILARMIEAVKQAQNTKPPIAHLADQIAAVFVPAVIVFAVIAAGVWWWLVPEFQFGFTVFMTVLIIACPCALGLAVPLSIVVGMNRATKLGIVIRNSDALQRASTVDTVILDKTGTLTEGKPEVTDVTLDDLDSLKMLASVALSLEAHSLHPLASAVVRHFEGAEKLPLENLTSEPGLGIKALHQGKRCAVGNELFMREQGYVDFTKAVSGEGSHVFVGYDTKILGVIALQDKIRESSFVAVRALQDQGIEVVLLSGDRAQTVADVAQKLGLNVSRAQMSPGDKQEFIASRQNSGAKVAMVGDGINDALALSQADVGFAMGTGSDIAIESADLTLIQNDLSNLPRALLLARKVMTNIRQNLFAAFIYNVSLLPVAAGVLFPLTGTLLNPGLAGLAMALSSLSVVANAGRLKLMA